MRIVRLLIENVKKIKVADFTFGPDALVVISGRNGSGKSTALDSVAYVLGGAKEIPPEVMRRGADYSQVMLETETLIATRRWKRNDNGTITVKSKDGAKYGSPVAMLEGLVGKRAFDPVAFMRLPAKDQAAALRDLVGLDFRAHDDKRRGIYDERADINRALNALQVLVEAAPAMDDVPDKPVSTTDLVFKLELLNAEAKSNAERRSDLQGRRNALENARGAAERAREAMERAQMALEAAENLQGKVEQEVDSLEATVRALVDPDTTDVRHQLEQSGAVNERVRAKRALQEQRRELDETKKQADALTAKIAAMDADKAAALAGAPFPVPGLGFGADGVTLNGLPLEQASSAERLRVSVAMGFAANPTLKALLIRDGSLLDDESRNMVRQMAEEAGGQVLMEVVPDDGDGWEMHDGQVRYEPGQPAEPSDESASEARKRLRDQYKFPRTCGDNGLAETRELAGQLGYAQHDDELHDEDRS